jgi:ADP-ribose pyrophosphatase
MTAPRRLVRLRRYDELRVERPWLFENPPGAAYEILLGRADQEAVANEAAAALRASDKPEEYGDIGVMYEDAYVILVRDAVRFRTGRLGAYIRLLSADTGTNAAVLPVLDDGRVLLVSHFRHASRRWHWEIPRGFSELGADGASTAMQELWEEIGVRVTEVHLLGSLSNDSDADEIYLAEIAADSVAGPDLPDGATEEGIDQMRLVTVDELEGMIAAGEITDSYVLAAYAFGVARGLLRSPG